MVVGSGISKDGNLSSALEHFRFLANTRASNLYQTDARFRMTQLAERLGSRWRVDP